MNPPGLYDGIRVIVPGVALAGLIDIVLYQVFGIQASAAGTLAAGVIAGMLITPISLKLDSHFIRWLVNKQRFRNELETLVKVRVEELRRDQAGCPPWPETLKAEQIFAAVRAHYSSRHNSPELYAFRSSIAYAHMHFALGLIFTLGAIGSPIVALLRRPFVELAAAGTINVSSVDTSQLIQVVLAAATTLGLFVGGVLLSTFAAQEEIKRAFAEELLYWRGASNATIAELRFYPGDLGDKYPSSEGPKNYIGWLYLRLVRSIAAKWQLDDVESTTRLIDLETYLDKLQWDAKKRVSS